jgi:hypothetical protein
MPSNAFNNTLTPLLLDVGDLIGAHEQGRTGQRGRQWNLAGLNRSIVVMAVSAWEAYVEHVVVEAIEAMRPPNPPLGTWSALKASAASARGRFNTPNPDNVKNFVRDHIGLDDVTTSWFWQGTTSTAARVRLSDVLNLRHQIAHGVHPRPTVNHGTARGLPDYFRRLAGRTDAALRDYLAAELGVQVNW